ncbi:MAG: hypothetical protein KatS3mg002_1223 [Candidatus Woesearchaeota archaeon]|nr:MAG: hypothetical protein KatS3mg002_1223 [Candidatus Woesearchaeota archaeon]
MNSRLMFWIIGLFFLVSIIILSFSNAENIVGNNYRNVTVRTFVNITNARPEVLSVNVYQESNTSLLNITLSGGGQRRVTCNASLRDWNGYNDIVIVNATLWHSSSTLNSPDDNNSHYTNSSCTNSGNGVNYTVNYICGFDVYYYANNGTWTCFVNVEDQGGKTGNNSNTTYVYPLYALNVTDGIDYGSVAVEEYSANRTANITNFGNMPINISVEGYGAVRGDGLAMNCSLFGNITVSMERFSTSDVDWSLMNPLSSSPQLIPGLTIPKQTLPSTPMVNTTYWQLYVNVSNNPAGNCTGYIIFQAEAS